MPLLNGALNSNYENWDTYNETFFANGEKKLSENYQPVSGGELYPHSKDYFTVLMARFGFVLLFQVHYIH